RAIEVLGDVPKGVSQSNAEELLSSRVYTDPGHFLVELLQNAEDAGATEWRVDVRPDRIVVWHDGEPFDFRDVVGITSIGQTTKSQSEIGFFGVGFKSVYEVTDRPRLYSDIFNFEIIDVSIPQWLGGERPDDLPQTGTVLVLPLDRDPDEALAPSALYAKARELDPWVVFPLPNIETIDLRLAEDCEQGPRRYAFGETDLAGPGRAGIAIEPAGRRRDYALEHQTYTYQVDGRAASRPDETDVMIGVRLDEQGCPRPVDPEVANIYSYLPTEQDSGLRFFVQGHFDVPVDRERIDPESAWNRWILEKVPDQLLGIAERIADEDSDERRLARARGLLRVLPAPGELNARVFEVVAEKMTEVLAEVPILPGTDGRLHRPDETLIASPRLTSLIDDGRIDARRIERLRRSEKLLSDGPPIWRSMLRADLDARSRSIARQLGAEKLELLDLVDIVEAAFAEPDGETSGGAADEGLFTAARRGEPEALSALYDALLEALERAEREEGRLAAMRLRQ
ncbi:MAG: sacsin N-terminal ATP-binding-like domain-containing protein, partial [Bradymonadaceae bacterium]